MPEYVECAVWHNRVGLPIGQVLKEQLAKRRPPLFWREPANGPEPLEGFHALLTPDDSTSGESWNLTEARLFYPDGLLHLVADRDGTRWAAWCASQTADKSPGRPTWIAIAALAASETPNARVSLEVRPPRKLLLRQGGISGQSVTILASEKSLVAVKYYDSGVLRWWRLEIDG